MSKQSFQNNFDKTDILINGSVVFLKPFIGEYFRN